MKMKSLKLEWEKFTRATGGRTLAVAGTFVAVLALALWTGSGAPKNGAPTDLQAAASLHATVDLEESPGHYTVTLAVPGDKEPQMDIRMDDRTLRIASGKSQGGVRFEQSLLLPKADLAKNPVFDRQKGKLVITVPKTPANSATAAASAPASGAVAANPPPQQGLVTPSQGALGAWNGQIARQFRRMQRQMDWMFDQAMNNYGQADPFANMMGNGFMDMLPGGGTNLQDTGTSYVIHASVPGDSTDDVAVSVSDGRVLKITARNEDSTGNNFQSSNYTQVLTLPGPVKAEKMKFTHANGDLVITLPKA